MAWSLDIYHDTILAYNCTISSITKKLNFLKSLQFEMVIRAAPDSKIFNDKDGSSMRELCLWFPTCVLSTGGDKQPAGIWTTKTTRSDSRGWDGDLQYKERRKKAIIFLRLKGQLSTVMWAVCEVFLAMCTQNLFYSLSIRAPASDSSFSSKAGHPHIAIPIQDTEQKERVDEIIVTV